MWDWNSENTAVTCLKLKDFPHCWAELFTTYILSRKLDWHEIDCPHCQSISCLYCLCSQSLSFTLFPSRCQNYEGAIRTAKQTSVKFNTCLIRFIRTTPQEFWQILRLSDVSFIYNSFKAILIFLSPTLQCSWWGEGKSTGTLIWFTQWLFAFLSVWEFTPTIA